MSKHFRPWRLDEALMLPPSADDVVPDDHFAPFVRSLFCEELHRSEVLKVYNSPFGQPPYDPWMMTGLLRYGHAVGVCSSRRIAKASTERVDSRAITALQRPDFRTIADFRKRHRKAFEELFVHVLRVVQKAGPIKLGCWSWG